MDFDQYVAARYGRLIEQAVLLGCAEGEAGPVVDRVLIAERRRIRRAKDPDPLVREALERQIRDQPVRRRHGGPIAAVALVAGLALVGAIVTYQPSPSDLTMPSLFGYDGPRAETYLHQLGLDVRLDPVSGCEPGGQVIGSQPQPGQDVEEGTTVRVSTALPLDAYCIPDYSGRELAWSLIGFSLGGAAPDLAPSVQVVRAAATDSGDDATRLTLTGTEAGDRDRWGDVLDEVALASRTQVPSPSGMASLDVAELVPPAHFCGQDRPPGLADRSALRVQIDTSARADATCPLTLDVYRSADGAIDTVVLYTSV